MRGYSVHALFCGQVINKCDNQTILKSNPFSCSLCYFEQKRFIDTFNLIPHYYFNILDKWERDRINKFISKKSSSELLELVYDETMLGNQIMMAVIRYLLSSKIDLIIKEFAFSSILSYEVTKKLKPKFVLLSHGVYSTWGGAIEACKIKVIIWGRGYVKGNIIADFNDSYIFECAKESNDLWEKLNLTNEQKEKIFNYFKDKKNPLKTSDYVSYYDKESNNILNYEGFHFLKN